MSTTFTFHPSLSSIGPQVRATGNESNRSVQRTAGPATDLAQNADEVQLRKLCQVLNFHQVEYVIFGSFAGRLQGAPLRTVDVDVVPEMPFLERSRGFDAHRG